MFVIAFFNATFEAMNCPTDGWLGALHTFTFGFASQLPDLLARPPTTFKPVEATGGHKSVRSRAESHRKGVLEPEAVGLRLDHSGTQKSKGVIELSNQYPFCLSHCAIVSRGQR